MTRRGFLLGAAGAALLASLAGCVQSESLRYRVTVEVDTPQGLRTGSSVWHVDSQAGPAFPGPEAASISSNIRGEAVTVDLPGGETLFALMRGAGGDVDYPTQLVQRHLAEHPDPRVETTPGAWAENRRRIQRSGIAFELTEDEYPMLVRFRDRSDPTTVEQVEPGDLDEAFGPGVRLRRITVEMTQESPTQDIIGILPWLDEYAEQGRRLNGNSGIITTNELADNLGSGSFLRRP